MRLLIAIALALSASSPIYAYQALSCAKDVWLKYGIMRKYDVKYTSVGWLSSRTSEREGYFKTAFISTGQNTTMAVDPGISTGQSYSHTQFTSSFGSCSAAAARSQWMEREIFLAENFGSIRMDAAKGGGEYIQSFSILSGCSSSQAFSSSLKAHFSEIFAGVPWKVSRSVDEVIARDGQLNKECIGI